MWNDTNETKVVELKDITLRDWRGRIFHPSSDALAGLAQEVGEQMVSLREVQPGIKKDVWIAFEVPSNLFSNP